MTLNWPSKRCCTCFEPAHRIARHYHYLPPSAQRALFDGTHDQTSTLRYWEDKILDAFDGWIEENRLLHWISPQEWLSDTTTASGSFAQEYILTLIFHVDGTVIPVLTPSDTNFNKQTYNSKHDENAWQFFVVVTQTGRIVHLSTIEGGKIHDKTHWEKNEITDKLEVRPSLFMFCPLCGTLDTVEYIIYPLFVHLNAPHRPGSLCRARGIQGGQDHARWQDLPMRHRRRQGLQGTQGPFGMEVTGNYDRCES